MSRFLLFALGVLNVVNGLAMIAAPSAWYAATPGAPDTGPANTHFIVDIGLAYAASGSGLMCAFAPGAAARALVLAGAVWPALHGLFHVWEWASEGPPSEFAVAAVAALGVMAPGLVGLALAVLHFRATGEFHAEGLSAPQDRRDGAGVRL